MCIEIGETHRRPRRCCANDLFQQIENVYQTQLSQNNEVFESKRQLEKDVETQSNLTEQLKEKLRVLTCCARAEMILSFSIHSWKENGPTIWHNVVKRENTKINC
jgi:hypothetical protein